MTETYCLGAKYYTFQAEHKQKIDLCVFFTVEHNNNNNSHFTNERKKRKHERIKGEKNCVEKNTEAQPRKKDAPKNAPFDRKTRKPRKNVDVDFDAAITSTTNAKTLSGVLFWGFFSSFSILFYFSYG